MEWCVNCLRHQGAGTARPCEAGRNTRRGGKTYTQCRCVCACMYVWEGTSNTHTNAHMFPNFLCNNNI